MFQLKTNIMSIMLDLYVEWQVQLHQTWKYHFSIELKLLLFIRRRGFGGKAVEDWPGFEPPCRLQPFKKIVIVTLSCLSSLRPSLAELECGRACAWARSAAASEKSRIFAGWCSLFHISKVGRHAFRCLAAADGAAHEPRNQECSFPLVRSNAL
jgi:hypothetical protein